MASTEKLPSGRYRALYVDSAGAKKRVPGTFARKQDAIDAAVDAQAKAKRQAAAKAGTLSAKMPWREWWEICKADRDFPSDAESTERSIVKLHLEPRWGDTPLVEIEQPDVKKWVAKLYREHSDHYARRIFSLFRTTILAAVERGVLTASPCAGVKAPKPTKKPMRYLTAEEAEAIARELDDHRRRAVLFMADTGIRPGELAGLHAHRLDLARGWLTVAETYVHLKKQIKPWPKNRKSRKLPLTARAIELVREALAGRDLKQACGVQHMGNGKCAHVLVFTTADGGVMDRDRIRQGMNQAAEKLKLDPASGYALRRGYPTRLAENGVDPFAIQRLMGHSTMDQSAEYVQETEAHRRRVVAALGDPAPLTAVPDKPTEQGADPRGTDRGTDLPGDAGASGVIEDPPDTG